MVDIAKPPSAMAGADGRGLSDIRIGLLPLPVFVAAAAVTILAVVTGRLPNDVIGGLSVLMLMGMLLGKAGQEIPILNQIGGTAILCLFVSSAMVAYPPWPISRRMPRSTHVSTSFQR